MKKQLLFVTLFVLFVGNYCFSQIDDPIGEYMSKSTVKAATGLNAPTNLKGAGLQVAGQSTSPYDINFTWTDNSTGEDGYKFQRYIAGIYWDFGCMAAANATSKKHTLSFMPGVTEKFRLFSYIDHLIFDDKSPFAYVTVEMLRPDLTVSNASISKTTVNAGEQITVRCQVNNIGTYAAGASSLIIRVSNGTSYTSVGTIPIGALAVGTNSGIKTASVIIPANYIGDYSIQFYAYISKELSKSNSYANIPIKILNKDLTIVSPSLSKTAVNAGESITASCSVKNIGTLSAPASTLKYYIGTTPTGTTKELASKAVGAIGAGATVAAGSTSITIPSTYTDGTYYIVFYADAPGIVPENNETNNMGSVMVTVSNPKPDLSFTGMSLSGGGITSGYVYCYALGGNFLDMYPVLKNIGSGGLPRTTDVKFYLSTENSLTSGTHIYLGSVSDIDLSAGESASLSLSVDLPYEYNGTNLATGYYYIICIADESKYISESNEANNIISQKFVLYGSGKKIGPLPDPIFQGSLVDDVVVYPNPTNGLVNMRIQKVGSSGLTVEFVDSNGRIIKSEKVSDVNEVRFDLSDQPKGVYFMKIMDNNGVKMKKVILE